MQIDETTSAGSFLAALQAFAALPAKDQQKLLRDVVAGRDSKPDIQTVRDQLAEAIDGAEDEEIADALRHGLEEED